VPARMGQATQATCGGPATGWEGRAGPARAPRPGLYQNSHRPDGVGVLVGRPPLPPRAAASVSALSRPLLTRLAPSRRNPPSPPPAAQEPFCVTQARAIQTKGGACDSGNTNYRGDTDSTVNLSCPDLVKKVRRKEREIERARVRGQLALAIGGAQAGEARPAPRQARRCGCLLALATSWGGWTGLV